MINEGACSFGFLSPVLTSDASISIGIKEAHALVRTAMTEEYQNLAFFLCLCLCPHSVQRGHVGISISISISVRPSANQ